MIQSRHQQDLEWLAASFALHLEGSLGLHPVPSEHPVLDRWPEPITLRDLLALDLDETWLEAVRGDLARRSLPRE